MSNLPFGAGPKAGPEEGQGARAGTTRGEPSPLAALEGAVLRLDDEDMANTAGSGSCGLAAEAAGAAGAAKAAGAAAEPGTAGVSAEAGGASCVALHYGNPGTEERALARGAAFTDLSDREIVQLAGADRLKLLESLTSQRVEDLAPGQTRELLLLSPQGHIENQALAADDGESCWLLCDAGYGQAFADFLTRMRFMMQVEAAVRPDLGAVGMYAKPGESPFEALALPGGADSMPGESAVPNQSTGAPDQASAPLPIWADPWPDLEPHGALYGPEPERHPARFRRLHIAAVPRESLLAVAHTLIENGIRPAGSLAAEAIRVVSWRPRMGTEGAAPKAIAHELDWLRTAVHLDKGCYRGQETIAKVVNLGRPPRRLTMLYLEGAYGELPEPGTPVEWNGRTAGVVTSSVRSVDDGPVALALLRRAVPGDAVLDLGEYRAGQRAIVNLEGKSSVSPSVMPGAELRGRAARNLPAGRGLAGTELGGRE